MTLKCLRLLAKFAVWGALVYPLIEATDWTAITDGDFEFQVLSFLLVLGIVVALLRLTLLAVQMLIRGLVRTQGPAVINHRCRQLFSMVRPPGLDPPPLLSLRI